MTDLIFNADELKQLELENSITSGPIPSSTINAHSVFPPQQLILLFDHNQWEEFVKEWGHCKKKEYKLVTRLGGANDYGVDVACFHTENGFLGSWDNFQCKHYADPLAPSDALPEVGKLLWHTFQKRITKPNNYYFFAPKDCGPALKKLLLNVDKLKVALISNWDKACSKKITTTEPIKLEGDFLSYVENFDFGIFSYKPSLDVLDEHRATPYHAARFGGGLAARPKSAQPPQTPVELETRYIQQLLEAYSDCGEEIVSHDKLIHFPEFNKHFNRSRETFYEAESLITFARDTVPNGTFEELQDEVYFGVKDVEEDAHDTAFKCVKEVTKTAAALNVQANGLSGVVKVKDLHGICHQLANDDRLRWRKK